jgi:hypothetical protein
MKLFRLMKVSLQEKIVGYEFAPYEFSATTAQVQQAKKKPLINVICPQT